MRERVAGAWGYLLGTLLCLLGCNAKSSAGSADGSETSSDFPSGGSTTTGGGSTVFVDQIRDLQIRKLDLLLVLDNGPSMGAKQDLLSQSVNPLLRRLILPDCVTTDDSGEVTGRWPRPDNATPGNPCPAGGDLPAGSKEEFEAIDDIHIGVISASLGGHGGQLCSPGHPDTDHYNETMNDGAWLLPTVRDGLVSFNNQGFLAWDPGNAYGGEDDRVQLTAGFIDHVTAAGTAGCGFPAALEAWYRFLIDPSPPVAIVNDGSFAYPTTDPNTGQPLIDGTVLAQRQAFLRRDSAVAIVMLTDADDCSIVDGGIGWLTTTLETADGAFSMPPATEACDANPNDACCRSCQLAESSPPAGCAPLDVDPSCAEGRAPDGDSLELRCYRQKQRFGFDLLYPVERYLAGLKDPQVYDTHSCNMGQCELVTNPLYAARDAVPRDPSHVFLMGIVGVPWQDIATPGTLSGAELEYLTASELPAVSPDRWSVILGRTDEDNPTAPLDPLMVESIEPREGVHPITGEALAPADSTDPEANSINGHEYVNTDSSDLQYACIFPLAEPRDCSASESGCECSEADLERNRALCNPPEGGPAGTTQYFDKAYPSPRILEVLRDFGDNAVVASACPKFTDDAVSEASYGYNPAMAALVERLAPAFAERCLPRQLSADEEGRIPCQIIEASLASGECDPAQGRSAEISEEMVSGVQQQLEAVGACGGATGVDCEMYQLCEIQQLSGSELDVCRNQIEYPGAFLPGFCYIDADQQVGNPALLQGCPPHELRKLQFVGDNTPASGALTFIACGGAPLSPEE